ncbi:MAG: hypothetical protein LBJ88_04085 [Campylobacteraceae bacterium]|nr:hypothetical protein [Campylobacteraceae bacterium]
MAALLTFVLVVGWILVDSLKTKHVVKIYFTIGMLIVWGTYLFMKLEDWNSAENRYMYMFLIPIFLLLIFKVYKVGKQKPISIVAKQQSYWNISPKDIYKCYKNRTYKKDDRIETRLDITSKQVSKQYSNEALFISTDIMRKIKNIKLTKIDNINEIENFKLYSLVFGKIKSILKYLEKDVNFENVLKENDMCVEYFLLDLWEQFTKNFNLGTANLEVYATNDTQKEFVRALDNVSLNAVKQEGSALLYLFMKFKNRMGNNKK